MGVSGVNAAFSQEFYRDPMPQSHKAHEASVFPRNRTLASFYPVHWVKSLESRFQKLVSLPNGWDGYQGQAVSVLKAHFAIGILNNLYRSDLPAPDVVPGSDGTLQIEWHLNGIDIELDILDVNKVNLYLNDDILGLEEELGVRTDFTVVWQWLEVMSSRCGE